MLKTQSVAAALAASLLLSGPVLADGSDDRGPIYESNFIITAPPPWGLSSYGIRGDGRLAPDVGRMLYITNARPDDDATPLNVAPVAPVTVGTANGLEAALGLSIGSLDGWPGEGDYATEGSVGLYQITSYADVRFAFDWSFASVDTLNPDFAFYVLDGVVTPLADALSGTFLPGDAPFGRDTGWATVTSGTLAAGVHTLAFGVVDVNDFVASSALDVRNFAFLPVPEADSRWLLACGLLALAGGRFARQRATRRGH
jgi:hypothetical protein